MGVRDARHTHSGKGKTSYIHLTMGRGRSGVTTSSWKKARGNPIRYDHVPFARRTKATQQIYGWIVIEIVQAEEAHLEPPPPQFAERRDACRVCLDNLPEAIGPKEFLRGAVGTLGVLGHTGVGLGHGSHFQTPGWNLASGKLSKHTRQASLRSASTPSTIRQAPRQDTPYVPNTSDKYSKHIQQVHPGGSATAKAN